jgi:hypothetical protein
VVGYGADGVYLRRNGTVTRLLDVPVSCARINDSGWIILSYRDENGTFSRAYLLTPDG